MKLASSYSMRLLLPHYRNRMRNESQLVCSSEVVNLVYTHEANFFKQTMEADDRISFLKSQTTILYPAKKKINLNSYPESLLTVLKGEVHHYFILKVRVQLTLGDKKPRRGTEERVVHIRPAAKNTPMKTLGIKPCLASQNLY